MGLPQDYGRPRPSIRLPWACHGTTVAWDWHGTSVRLPRKTQILVPMSERQGYARRLLFPGEQQPPRASQAGVGGTTGWDGETLHSIPDEDHAAGGASYFFDTTRYVAGRRHRVPIETTFAAIAASRLDAIKVATAAAVTIGKDGRTGSGRTYMLTLDMAIAQFLGCDRVVGTYILPGGSCFCLSHG